MVGLAHMKTMDCSVLRTTTQRCLRVERTVGRHCLQALEAICPSMGSGLEVAPSIPLQTRAGNAPPAAAHGPRRLTWCWWAVGQEVGRNMLPSACTMSPPWLSHPPPSCCSQVSLGKTQMVSGWHLPGLAALQAHASLSHPRGRDSSTALWPGTGSDLAALCHTRDGCLQVGWQQKSPNISRGL